MGKMETEKKQCGVLPLRPGKRAQGLTERERREKKRGREGETRGGESSSKDEQ